MSGDQGLARASATTSEPRERTADPMNSSIRPRRGLRGVVEERAGRSRDRARRWNSAMVAQAEQHPYVGTRWGRSAWALVPATIAVAAIGLAISEGVLAANFAVNDQPFSLHVGTLEADGGLQAVLAAEKAGGGKTSGVVHAGVPSGHLSNLCILVHQSVLGVDYTISVGSSGGMASGNNVYFDITDLQAQTASLSGAILGESADLINLNGQSLGGAKGGFGLDEKGKAVLTNITGTAYQAQVAGALTLPNLGIHVKLGSANSC
jgi:hypothetical protein